MYRMKIFLKCVFLVFMSLQSVFLLAQEYLENDAHFVQGNVYYERARFDSAVFEYERILEDSVHHPMVYYNLGNAYFRLQQYPKAILNYERALKLSPNSEDIVFNLALARSFTLDKLESPEEVFLSRWWSSFRDLFSSKEWAILSLVFLGVTLLGVLLLRFFVPRSRLRNLFIVPFVSILLFFFTLGLAIGAQYRLSNQDMAIIMQSVVSVKSSPDVAGKDLFLLHAGTKVSVLRKIGTWYEISIPDGHQGWVEESILSLI